MSSTSRPAAMRNRDADSRRRQPHPRQHLPTPRSAPPSRPGGSIAHFVVIPSSDGQHRPLLHRRQRQVDDGRVRVAEDAQRGPSLLQHAHHACERRRRRSLAEGEGEHPQTPRAPRENPDARSALLCDPAQLGQLSPPTRYACADTATTPIPSRITTVTPSVFFIAAPLGVRIAIGKHRVRGAASGRTTPTRELGPPTLRRGEMALSPLDPCAWMPSRADRRLLFARQGQPPFHTRRRGRWWASPVTIHGVTTTPRALGGGIHENHTKFRSPSDSSCVFCWVPRPPVLRQFRCNPSVRQGERRVARTTERTGSGLAHHGRGSSSRLPQGKSHRREDHPGEAEARQQDKGGPGPTAARTPKREIGCAEPRRRLRGTRMGRGVVVLVTRRNSASLRRTLDG